MDILCWNARGLTCTKFRYTMMELIHVLHVDILFVCEPRIRGAKALDVVKSLGFRALRWLLPLVFLVVFG